MALQWSCRAAVAAFLFACLGSSFTLGGARAQFGASFGGRATALHVAVPATGMDLRLADTGALIASSGGEGAALLAAEIPGTLTAGIVTLTAAPLHAAIVAADQSRADASLASVNVIVSGNGISADFLMARSAAKCAAAPSFAGTSQVANLVVNGQSIAVNDRINQTIALPNGQITINEQIGAVGETGGWLTVNVLHVTTFDLLTQQPTADVVLASANAQLECQSGFASIFPRLGWFSPVYAQTDPDKSASGGGWVPGNLGSKATFGFFATTETDGTFKGHVLFIDHSMSFSMESTSITVFTPGCTSTIQGTGNSNGTPVDFIVEVHDDGEPGIRDTFKIEVSNGYSNAALTLGGGNLQADGTWAGGKVLAHKPSCP